MQFKNKLLLLQVMDYSFTPQECANREAAECPLVEKLRSTRDKGISPISSLLTDTIVAIVVHVCSHTKRLLLSREKP